MNKIYEKNGNGFISGGTPFAWEAETWEYERRDGSKEISQEHVFYIYNHSTGSVGFNADQLKELLPKFQDFLNAVEGAPTTV